MSWPLILLGALGMVIFHGIQLFQKEDRVPLDYSRQLLIVTFLCNYIFSIFQLPYAHVLSVLTKAALIGFLILYIKEIITSLQGNTQSGTSLPYFRTENLSYLLADLATVYIVIASLFKILHWEFGIINSNVLLVIGLFSALISILASSKELGK